MEGWLKAALDYVPDWLEFQMQTWQRPGCVVAVADRGRIVLDRAFGVANVATREKLTPRHRFRVASHSKSFTAAGLMKLREQGALKLDDPIGRFLGARLHAKTASVTLQQLLTHSAGLRRDGVEAGYFTDERPFPTEDEVLRDLAGAPLIEPNTRFKYSNLGFALLGMAIEAIAGKSYAAWMADEILAPAGLAETTTDMPLPRGVRLMRGHSGRHLLGRRVVITCDQPLNALALVGGFVSTARDLALFFGQLAPNAKRSILSVPSRREMLRAQWTVPHSSLGGEYGLGLTRGRYNGWDWFGHSGGLQGFISRTACVPDRGLAVSVLTNSLDGLAAAWLDGILHIFQTFARHGAPKGRREGWRGRWWNLWATTDLVPMGAKVLCATPAFLTPFQDASEIAIIGRDRGRFVEANGYASFGESVRLVRDARGKVREVRFPGGRAMPRTKAAAAIARRYRNRRR
jgi:CubicO group peptidase (beta-lactamase class C family)